MLTTKTGQYCDQIQITHRIPSPLSGARAVGVFTTKEKTTVFIIDRDYFKEQSVICRENDYVPPELYDEYHIFRGLRDINGNGVQTGITNISKIKAFDMVDGVKTPCPGKLWYRGYPIEDLVEKTKDGFGFEKVAYLLITGKYPSEEEYRKFMEEIAGLQKLPRNFTRDVIMKAATDDIMNNMTRSILTLASYDRYLKDSSLDNVLRQCVQLVSEFPLLAIYGYHAFNHYQKGNSMLIHNPNPDKSIAENILIMLRTNKDYTPMEAKALDIALILHAEHGGGNNSTFTTRVVTSSGSDTYSTIAAAMSSLKGPRHGGANIKVLEMMKDICKNVSDTSDRDEVRNYLDKILEKEAFDKKGLIYGMGCTVYSVSDPREVIFKEYVRKLAKEKGKLKQLQLYEIVEEEGKALICRKRHIYKGVCPNIDFYSGFVYKMLGIPKELYTPIFAIARIAGWSAHRLEEIIGDGKIIRPAYVSAEK